MEWERRASSHLISQDAIESPRVDGDQPLQPHVLVLAQGSLQQEGHLHGETPNTALKGCRHIRRGAQKQSAAPTALCTSQQRHLHSLVPGRVSRGICLEAGPISKPFEWLCPLRSGNVLAQHSTRQLGYALLQEALNAGKTRGWQYPVWHTGQGRQTQSTALGRALCAPGRHSILLLQPRAHSPECMHVRICAVPWNLPLGLPSRLQLSISQSVCEVCCVLQEASILQHTPSQLSDHVL